MRPAGVGQVVPGGTRAPPAGPATAPAPTGWAEAGTALPPGTRVAHFEVTGVAGQGGFSIVYRAFDHSLQREVALKEFLPESLATRRGDLTVRVKSAPLEEAFSAGLRSFVNEARLLAQFDHPALVKVLQFWEANGTAYMVMPFYAGSTLKQVLHGRPAPVDEAWLRALLAPLLEALEAVHRADFYHRDIAPDNILLLPDDRPVLLDFGAARRIIGDMTQAVTVVLKPGYAPIEQYGDIPDLRQGPWTDVYALGAVLHYCITGRAPPVSVGRTVKDSYRPLSEAAAGRFSAPFLAAVDRALSIMPRDRPQNIAEFRDALGLALPAPEPAVHRAEAPPPKARGAPQRTRWLVAGLVATAAIALGAALLRPAAPDAAGPAETARPAEAARPPEAAARPRQDAAAVSGLPTSPTASAPGPSPERRPGQDTPAPTPPAEPPASAAAAPRGSAGVQAPAVKPAAPPRIVEAPAPTAAAPRTAGRDAAGPSAQRAPATQRSGWSERCTSLINRAQLGEPMSGADLAYLKEECR
jgi:hypothetical protein